MRYIRIKSEDFIENGRSKIRVQPVSTFPSRTSPMRTIRVFEVLQTITESPNNNLQRGQLIALSFPNESINAKEYLWFRYSRIEECMVPLQIDDKAVNLEMVNRKAKAIRKAQAELKEPDNPFNPEAN